MFNNAHNLSKTLASHVMFSGPISIYQFECIVDKLTVISHPLLYFTATDSSWHHFNSYPRTLFMNLEVSPRQSLNIFFPKLMYKKLFYKFIELVEFRLPVIELTEMKRWVCILGIARNWLV